MEPPSSGPPKIAPQIALLRKVESEVEDKENHEAEPEREEEEDTYEVEP